MFSRESSDSLFFAYILIGKSKDNPLTHIHTGEIMSDSKSGFEIRADLLNQAQGLLEGNLSREVDSVYAHNDNHPDRKKALPVREIFASDVIAVAQELNEFVNQK
jgi:hypothetical protein